MARTRIGEAGGGGGVEAVAAPGLAAAEALGEPGEERRRREREPEGQPVAGAAHGWRRGLCGDGGLVRRRGAREAAAREDGVRAHEGEGAHTLTRSGISEEVRLSSVSSGHREARLRAYGC